MKYIWINPVTAQMYQPDDLHRFLTAHGFIQLEASLHWMETVKEKYKQAVKTAPHTLIDMRCPKIIHLIEAYALQDAVTIPAIEPILLHCAREISQKKPGHQKIITTPCQALADRGNALHLPETTFLPWNQFLSDLGGGLFAEPPQESPIPPGFFHDCSCKKISVTGKDAICDFFAHFPTDTYDLIELLYCSEGCHNGDGICGCK